MKSEWRRIRQVLALAVVAALAACRTAPPATPDLPATPVAFKESRGWVQAAPAEGQPRGPWWTVFADPELDRLVDAAMRNNTSIHVAAAHLEKARALAGIAEANRMPQAGAGAGVSRQGGPLINAAGDSGTLWNVFANLSYELDLFGRLAGERDAARLDAESRAALLQSVRLLVQADVAQTFFALRAIDGERALVRATIASQGETLRTVERRFALGSVSALDVERLRTDLAETETELLALERRRAELEHALAILSGESASSFSLADAGLGAHLPSIPPGIPATLLTRRADVAAAQRGVLAAQARVGVAQTAWFPNLQLTTAQGLASDSLRTLIASAAHAWSVGALLSLPIFDGGRREAAVRGASADYVAAVANYRERVLTAFKDVEDQLAALRILAEQDRVQATAANSARRTTQLAASRYASGFASQLELLDAQRGELRLRRHALQVRGAQYQSTVGLIRALGGGWEQSPS